jgi:hypothetical protein
MPFSLVFLAAIVAAALAYQAATGRDLNPFDRLSLVLTAFAALVWAIPGAVQDVLWPDGFGDLAFALLVAGFASEIVAIVIRLFGKRKRVNA